MESNQNPIARGTWREAAGAYQAGVCTAKSHWTLFFLERRERKDGRAPGTGWAYTRKLLPSTLWVWGAPHFEFHHTWECDYPVGNYGVFRLGAGVFV